MGRKVLLPLAAWMARRLPSRLKLGLYRLGPLTDAIRGGLSRAAPEGLIHTQVAGGMLAGVAMRLDLQMEKDLWLGTYEAALQSAVSSLVKPGMTVYDVGANIGYTGLMFAQRVGEEGKVIALEPLPDNLARLRDNLGLNPIGSIVEVLPYAVGRRAGRGAFLVHTSTGMGKLEGSSGRKEAYPGRIEVDVVSLDEIVFGRGMPIPDVVKVDVEGGEVQVLQGMPRLLDEARPTLLMELHGPEAAAGVAQILSPAGYVFSRLDALDERLESLESVSWKVYIMARPGWNRKAGRREAP